MGQAFPGHVERGGEIHGADFGAEQAFCERERKLAFPVEMAPGDFPGGLDAGGLIAGRQAPFGHGLAEQEPGMEFQSRREPVFLSGVEVQSLMPGDFRAIDSRGHALLEVVAVVPAGFLAEAVGKSGRVEPVFPQFQFAGQAWG